MIQPTPTPASGGPPPDASGGAAADLLDLLSCAPGGLEIDLLRQLDPRALESLEARAGAVLEAWPPRVGFRDEALRRAHAAGVPAAIRRGLHERVAGWLEARPLAGQAVRRLSHALAAGGAPVRRDVVAQALAEAAAQPAVQGRLLRVAARLASGVTASERAGWRVRHRLAVRVAGHTPVPDPAAWQALRRRCAAAGDRAGTVVAVVAEVLEEGAGPRGLRRLQALAETGARSGADPAAGRWLRLALAATAAACGDAITAWRQLRRGSPASPLARTDTGTADALLGAALALARHVHATYRGRAAAATVDAGARRRRLEVLFAVLSSVPGPTTADPIDLPLLGLLLVRATEALLGQGDSAAAQALAEAGGALCSRLGQRAPVQRLALCRAWAAVDAGEFAEARRLLAGLPDGPLPLAEARRLLLRRIEAWQGEGDAQAALGRGGCLASGLRHRTVCERTWLAGRDATWRRRRARWRLAAGCPDVGTEPVGLSLLGGAADAALRQGRQLDAARARLGEGGAQRQRAAARLTGFGAHGLRLRRDGRGSADPVDGRVGARGASPRVRTDPLGLSPRERTVAEGLAQGLGNRALAERLCRSERTIAHQVSAVLAKLGVRRRQEVGPRLAAAQSPGR
ncbi:helix-turn-helix domain-containing protein [Piscinibacter sakaiensis]|uniref:HTH luxR-type domain-containing protein n=1 Tax=Piscinibacter sakaiensis TaxID=1547922 RepID=A0A0K8P0P1_PISS1|nr:helix-turn-helix transcriptional regulator [Piscinibacter sakaiensis]GAP36222.1 hypothetical protein ISF6_2062 [Piscinibacter sakaiensis]